jgi:hypothetical protein
MGGTDFATHISVWTDCPLNNGTLLVNQSEPVANHNSVVSPRGVDGYVPTCSLVRILVERVPAELFVLISGLGAAPKGQFAVNTTCIQEPTSYPTLAPTAGGCQYFRRGCGYISDDIGGFNNLNDIGGPDVSYLLEFSVDTILTVSLCNGEGSAESSVLVALFDGCVSDNGRLIGAASNAAAGTELLFGLTTDADADPDALSCSFLTVVPAGEYWLMVDGLTLDATGFFNVSVQCVDQTPKPSQEPTPKPSQEPSPTPTGRPSPLPTPRPSPLPSPKPSPVPTLVPTPIPSPVPTPKPLPLPTLSPTPVPSPSPSPLPTPVPSPRPTPVTKLTPFLVFEVHL